MKVMLKPVLWSILSLLMLCLFAVPGLNVIAMLLIFVPNTVLYTIVNRKVFAGCIILIWLLASIFVDPAAMLFLGFVAVIPSIILGELYLRKVHSTRIIPYLTAIVLLVLMVSLLVLDRVFSVSLISEFKSLLQSQYSILIERQMLPESFTTSMIDTMIASMINLVPLAMAMMAFFIVICSHYVARHAAGLNGIYVEAFPKAKDWNLPRKLVFIYFVLYLIQLFLDVTNQSFFTIAILNIVPALSFAFTVQAIGLFFYLANHYKWPKIVPILIAFPVLIFPLFSIVGVIDVAFKLRERLIKK